MTNEILLKMEKKAEVSIEVLARELGGIRSGRASPALVENIRIDYAGTPTPLIQLASISVPEARYLVIQPWDKSTIPAVEKAIMKSDLGLMPASDGNVIRLSIPPLSDERRQELTKLVHRRVEEDRVAIRNLRRDSHEDLKKLEKDKAISQDELKRATDTLQKLTDSFIARADKLGRDKENELMSL